MVTKTYRNEIDYISNRRTEQYADNYRYNSEKSYGTSIGVDYHVYRKEVAAKLLSHLLPNHQTFGNIAFTGRITKRHLNNEGRQYFNELLRAGVDYRTILAWMNKY